MTRVETHTQAGGQVIATARIGSRVIRVCGEKAFRGCAVHAQLARFIAHVNQISGVVDAYDALHAHVQAREELEKRGVLDELGAPG
jgi:predicted kinase